MYKVIDELINVIGVEATLKIIIGWGGLSLYVPDNYKDDHMITIIIGEDASKKLSKRFGGQTISPIPAPLKTLVKEVRLLQFIIDGYSVRKAAHIVDISYARAKQIVKDKKIHGDPERGPRYELANARKSASYRVF